MLARATTTPLRAARAPRLRPAAARTIVTLKDHKYTAHATAHGAGRNGETASGGLALTLAAPAELGGTGAGQNPEQLFAMGYAACLLGAIQLQARLRGQPGAARAARVHTAVHLGEPEALGGFGIAVDITVEGVDAALVQAGHEACPYSRALTRGAVVRVTAK